FWHSPVEYRAQQRALEGPEQADRRHHERGRLALTCVLPSSRAEAGAAATTAAANTSTYGRRIPSLRMKTPIGCAWNISDQPPWIYFKDGRPADAEAALPLNRLHPIQYDRDRRLRRIANGS